MVAAGIFVAIVVITAVAMAAPMMGGNKQLDATNEVNRLVSERDFLLQEIQDVKQDLDMNKITQDDFDRFVAGRKSKLAAVLEALAKTEADNEGTQAETSDAVVQS